MHRLLRLDLILGLLTTAGCAVKGAPATPPMDSSSTASPSVTGGENTNTEQPNDHSTPSETTTSKDTTDTGTDVRTSDSSSPVVQTEDTGSSIGTQGGTTVIPTGGQPTETSQPVVTVDTTPGTLGPFVCPPAPFAASPLMEGAAPQAVAGVPPVDDFAEETDTVILEGPVWLDGNLYLSQINDGQAFGGGFPIGPRPGAADAGVPEVDAAPPSPPPSRILKVTESGEVSIALDDTGTNGLAIDAQGALIGTNHALGSIVKLGLGGQPSVDLATSFDGIRFNSPNDLTFGANGALYFTDPDYQAPTPAPQAATRVYRVDPGSTTALSLVETRQPNGITLSPNRKTLYISASDGIVAYPVLEDGGLGDGIAFASDVVRSSDGMAVDCAGNLYTTSGQRVTIVDPTGAEAGVIEVSGVQSVTNVAFGDADHQTLYVTTLGTGTRVGLFKLRMATPGMPF
jgi:gluconolactonase